WRSAGIWAPRKSGLDPGLLLSIRATRPAENERTAGAGVAAGFGALRGRHQAGQKPDRIRAGESRAAWRRVLCGPDRQPGIRDFQFDRPCRWAFDRTGGGESVTRG